MKISSTLLPSVLTVCSLLALSCAPPERAAAPGPTAGGEAFREMGARAGELHDRIRHEALEERIFTHADLWGALGPVVDGAAQLEREEVARSVHDRPIFTVRYGSGPTTVLLWSQMHGDESTGTRALLDLFHWLAQEPDDEQAVRWAERLTIVAIPMLNPDGAERFERRNALGIDVNRDARTLATPEGRILRELQRDLQPEWGFNLHDQSARIRVDREDRIAAISLLAPPYDHDRSVNPVRLRAMKLAAVMRDAVEPHVGGHISQYDDSYNPRAFGDGMQRWGTSTVLLEAGAWRDDGEKRHLRKTYFAALVAAIDAIATGQVERADTARYRDLPFNGPLARDLWVRGGTIVLPDGLSYRADLAVNYDDPLRPAEASIVDVGDLDGMFAARDTLDAEGAYLHLERHALSGDDPAGPSLEVGQPAHFTVRQGQDPASPSLWRVLGGPPQRQR